MGMPVGPLTRTTKSDLALASVAWGFTLGFGFLTVWTAIKQTMATKNALRSTYLWLVWGELFANTGFGILAYLFLTEAVGPTFTVIFLIVLIWAFQVNLLLQIIINRINVIQGDRTLRNWLTYGVLALWLCINVSAFCIWIPARLGVSGYYRINYIWDRSEKSIYMMTDCLLNYYFVRLVRQRLVKQGSNKYQSLVTFNTRIIMLSLGMDVLLIASMGLKNDLIYLMIHPLSFIVKLNIEMSMASLIRKIAAQKITGHSDEVYGNKTYEMAISGGGGPVNGHHDVSHMGVMVHKSVIVESNPADDSSSSLREETTNELKHEAEDQSPLRQNEGWPQKTRFALPEKGDPMV